MKIIVIGVDESRITLGRVHPNNVELVVIEKKPARILTGLSKPDPRKLINSLDMMTTKIQVKLEEDKNSQHYKHKNRPKY
jgi:hypothetical protein